MGPSLGPLGCACVLPRLLGLRSHLASLPQPPQLEEPITLHLALRIGALDEARQPSRFGAHDDIAQGREHGLELRQGQRRDAVITQIAPLGLGSGILGFGAILQRLRQATRSRQRLWLAGARALFRWSLMRLEPALDGFLAHQHTPANADHGQLPPFEQAFHGGQATAEEPTQVLPRE